jgi:hypothetical protein
MAAPSTTTTASSIEIANPCGIWNPLLLRALFGAARLVHMTSVAAVDRTMWGRIVTIHSMSAVVTAFRKCGNRGPLRKMVRMM